MAKATTYRFSELLVLVGDGSSPEEFVAPCGLTSRGLNRSAETNDTNVPDCDDEDKPSWLERDKVSNAWSVSGSGVLAAEAVDTWDEWFGEDAGRNIRVVAGGKTWEGYGILTTYNVSGERGSRVTVEIEITGSGELVLVT